LLWLFHERQNASAGQLTQEEQALPPQADYTDFHKTFPKRNLDRG
jgi:hypothetical protein